LRYFQHYEQLPAKASRSLIAALQARPRFPSVVAELLRTAEGRIAAKQLPAVDGFVHSCLKERSPPGADYHAAILTWAIRRDLLPHRFIPPRVRRISAWWVQAEALAALGGDRLTASAKGRLVNELLLSPVSDVAVAAAVVIVTEGLDVAAKAKQVQRSAACILERFGRIRRGAARVCGIHRYFKDLLGPELPEIDWKKLFRKRYRRVEQQAVWCRAFARTDITAWVNGMDVFNDFLLEAVFKAVPTLGSYTIGNVGGILSCAALNANYPAVTALVREIHDKRGESALSHPVKTKGKARIVVGKTRRIRFGYLRRARKLVRAAVKELAATMKW
jgi:hypothetical protein